MDIFICLISGSLFLANAVQPPELLAPPTTARVRQLADGGGERYGTDVLVEYGRSAFPAYVVILTDPNSKADEIAGVLIAISHVNVPKRPSRN